MSERIAIFGSTGSIGVQALNVVRRFSQDYCVVGLSAGENTDLLQKQIAEFRPEFVASVRSFSSEGVRAFCGADAALRMAEECDADITVMAMSGIAALSPLSAILKKGRRIALANKEAIVCAGDLVTKTAKRYGTDIIPVDSEHSAVFQCLRVGERKDVKKIVLTASGGPFYACHSADFRSVTPEQAVHHPTWKMGKKISVDSATMVNKGLEIIEAARLFGVDEIDYVIHPESIVHSLVEYADGSTVALMSYPNMELAIQYALTYPRHKQNGGVRPFDYRKSLTFLPPDEARFPAPAIAKECLKKGGLAPAAFCIADEVAVELFLHRRIGFADIVPAVRDVLGLPFASGECSLEGIAELRQNICAHLQAKFPG